MHLDRGWIADVTGARGVVGVERIQSLWSGYGALFRVTLEGGPRSSCVVKWAKPPPAANDAVSDARKRRSYQVEDAFYRAWAPRCDARDRVAALLGRRVSSDEWVLVLEDLDAAGLGDRRRHLAGPELDATLAWLATFHARFLGEAPEDLWSEGSYWHLATRMSELQGIDDPQLRAAAPVLDRLLAGARHRTVIHGDAKEANFCFRRGKAGPVVAAVDFQYAGGGCGMRDVAYLLHGRADEPDDGIAHEHLATYFGHLRRALARREDPVDADAVEEEWRRLYPIAKADFARFLAGWASGHWRGDARGRRFLWRVLDQLA